MASEDEETGGLELALNEYMNTSPRRPATARHDANERFMRTVSGRGSQPTDRVSLACECGAPICREIVAAHGGRVWVEDADAAASAFSLALPAAAPATPGAAAGGAGAQNASGAAGSCAMSPENLPGIAVDRYLVPHEHKPSGVAP